MKLTVGRIREESNQLARILNNSVGNSKTSYAIRENIERLSKLNQSWLKTVQGDPLASKWLNRLRVPEEITDSERENLKENLEKYKEFESLEIDFEPYRISIEDLPNLMKVPIFVEDKEKNTRTVDRWEDDPGATDALVRSLRAIGALEA